MHKPQLLPPLPECHAGFLLKEPFDRPLARAALLANLTQRAIVARICGKDLGDSLRSWVRQMRQLQGDHFNRFQLIQNYANEMLP